MDESQAQTAEASEKPSLVARLKVKMEKYSRVIKITKKPTREEYIAAVKITGIGILLVGVIGYVLFITMGLTPIFG